MGKVSLDDLLPLRDHATMPEPPKPAFSEWLSGVGWLALGVLAYGAVWIGAILLLVLAYVFVVGGLFGIITAVRWTGIPALVAEHGDKMIAVALFSIVATSWALWLFAKKK